MVGDFRTRSYVEGLTDLAMFRLGRKKETKENHHNHMEQGIRLSGVRIMGQDQDQDRSVSKCQLLWKTFIRTF